MKVVHLADDITIATDNVGPAIDGESARCREKEAVGKLLKHLLGDVELCHNAVGKPEICGFNISLSHSLNKQGGYVSVILSKTHEVGIDIEYRSNRIMKIASRFLRDDEVPVSVEDHLVYWCAKEAVYKLFSADDLTYQQMRVNASMNAVDVLKIGITVKIHTIITPEYVLVWTAKQ